MRFTERLPSIRPREENVERMTRSVRYYLDEKAAQIYGEIEWGIDALGIVVVMFSTSTVRSRDRPPMCAYKMAVPKNIQRVSNQRRRARAALVQLLENWDEVPVSEGELEVESEIDRLKREERLAEALLRIRDWALAYPLEAFPEPNGDYRRAATMALEAQGLSLARIAASDMRHVITQVRKICEEALS
jgi:hypothetical protein